eukprot:TRINITY_DN2516_c0_g1_i1.p1 TRINITY_DN2516_c0_g1~~TRINITY_DN2516_c0_g1_i1.p1  ORF type:complete len:573 (+),score=193.30 TRINITY_DN2516_c0_g1_i1:189-1721(+)
MDPMRISPADSFDSRNRVPILQPSDSPSHTVSYYTQRSQDNSDYPAANAFVWRRPSPSSPTASGTATATTTPPASFQPRNFTLPDFAVRDSRLSRSDTDVGQLLSAHALAECLSRSPSPEACSGIEMQPSQLLPASHLQYSEHASARSALPPSRMVSASSLQHAHSSHSSHSSYSSYSSPYPQLHAHGAYAAASRPVALGARGTHSDEDNKPHSISRKAQHPVSAISKGEHASSKQQKRKKLPPGAILTLRIWLCEHSKQPYPNEEQKQELMRKTGLTRSQINNWFSGARRRMLKDPAYCDRVALTVQESIANPDSATRLRSAASAGTPKAAAAAPVTSPQPRFVYKHASEIRAASAAANTATTASASAAAAATTPMDISSSSSSSFNSSSSSSSSSSSPSSPSASASSNNAQTTSPATSGAAATASSSTTTASSMPSSSYMSYGRPIAPKLVQPASMVAPVAAVLAAAAAAIPATPAMPTQVYSSANALSSLDALFQEASRRTQSTSSS